MPGADGTSTAHGNLKHAMRDNYNEHGVDEYYRKVAASYRNPFFPGIKKVVYAFMNTWYARELEALQKLDRPLRILDMAAGSGEATLCLLEWEQAARGSQPGASRAASSISAGIASSTPASRAFIPPNARRPMERPDKKAQLGATMARIPATTPLIDISAADPFTKPAYEDRTGRPCHPLSFTDLASGSLPPGIAPGTDGAVWDMVVCSFALHLVPESEMFPLCWELSTKVRWLVVIAPHKKPEIKEGWGWARWDLRDWSAAGDKIYRKDPEENETELEIVREKTKLRLYRSTQIE